MTSLLLLALLAADEKKESTPPADGEVSAEAPKVASAAAAGATAVGQQWSVVTARTVGAGHNALQGGLGFPGFDAQFEHGITSTFDLGARFSLNYGLEGQVAAPGPWQSLPPGVKVQGLAKVKFYEGGKVNIGASFAPGPLFFFPRFLPTQVGFALPLALCVGIVATPALNVGVKVELPMWVKFGDFSSFVMPILMGAGFEYFVTSNLLAFFDLRMGPSIWTNGLGTVFTFDGKLGVGWRF